MAINLRIITIIIVAVISSLDYLEQLAHLGCGCEFSNQYKTILPHWGAAFLDAVEDSFHG